jgi:hypothetical protein
MEAAGLMYIESATDSMLSYMEPDQRKQLLSMAINIAKQLGEDTHDSVRLTLKKVLQELL